MLWSVTSGQAAVVSILDERDDRWVGRRCQVALTSFEAPIEMFMKSDWRRDEQPKEQEPEPAAPATDPRSRYLSAFKGAATP